MDYNFSEEYEKMEQLSSIENVANGGLMLGTAALCSAITERIICRSKNNKSNFSSWLKSKFNREKDNDGRNL